MELNISRLKENYPKTFEILNNSDFNFNHIRDLYDFFDSKSLIVEVSKNDITDWGYTLIHDHHISCEANKESRKQAELDGFTLAFKILEKSL